LTEAVVSSTIDCVTSKQEETGVDVLRTLSEKLRAREERISREGFDAAVIVPLICPGGSQRGLVQIDEGVHLNGRDDCGPADQAGSIDLLFELRAPHLRRSSGEVGFPGGLLEPGEHPYEAALRELEEELGIRSEQVTLLGRLPRLLRRRDELITPYVCHISGKFPLRVQDEEVAEVFTIPLKFFQEHPLRQASIIEERHLSRDFPHHLLPRKQWRSRSEYPIYYLCYRDKLIWGLTAEIVRRLLALLPDSGPDPGP
jgi:coenzyme A diphosphatase NUDT7